MDTPKKLHVPQLESWGWPTNPRNCYKYLGIWIWPHFDVSRKYYTVSDGFSDRERLTFLPWGTSEVPVDFLSQFLIEFAKKKITDRSWWRCSRQRISYRPPENNLPWRVNDTCLVAPGSIAPCWFTTAHKGILDHCARAAGFSLDHCV
jgi:hypothetical protein